MLSLVHALNHPDIRVLSDDGDTLVVRIVGPLYFANMQRVRAQLNQLVREHEPRVLELEMSGVAGLDITALEILPEFDRELRERAVTLRLTNLNERPLALLLRSPASDLLGERVR
jgi:MFS superfamily sulfate permease-like transporter